MSGQACKPACEGDFEMCNLPAGRPGTTECQTCGDPNSSAINVNNCCNTDKVHGIDHHNVYQYCYNQICDTTDRGTAKYLTCGADCGGPSLACCDAHHPLGLCPFPDGNQRLVPHDSMCELCGKDTQLVCDDVKACDHGLFVTSDGKKCRTLPSAQDWPTCKSTWQCEDHIISTNCIQGTPTSSDATDATHTHGLKVKYEYTGANPRKQACLFQGCKRNQDHQHCRILLADQEKPTG